MTMAPLASSYSNPPMTAYLAEAEAASQYARQIVGTAFTPASLRLYTDNHDLDLPNTVAQVAMALLSGQELGLSPLAALRSINIIPPGTGSPALTANAMRGLVQSHGHEVWRVEATDTRCIYQGRRKGSDIVEESVWTIDRVKKMHLRGAFGPEGNYVRMPQAMLTARATGEICRLVAMDVLLGMPYTVEELLDNPDSPDGGPPSDGGMRGGPPAATRKARARAILPAAPEPDSEPGSQPQAPPEPPRRKRGRPPKQQPAESDQPRMITAAQRARLWPALRRIGITDNDGARAFCGLVLNRQITSQNDMTEDDASRVLEATAVRETQQAKEAQDAAAEAPDEPAPDDDRQAAFDDIPEDEPPHDD